MLSDKLIPVRSSCFNASGYFGGRAAFRYRNGSVIFRRIPVTLWQQFMEAGSKGKFFREKIKGLHGAGRGTSPLAQTPGVFSVSGDSDRVVSPSRLNQVRVADYSTATVSRYANPEARFNLQNEA